MSHYEQDTILICPDHIRWVKDAEQTIVVDEQRSQLFSLRGTEAAVWDWLALGYSYSRLVQLLSALLDMDEADEILIHLLRQWEESGLLMREDALHG